MSSKFDRQKNALKRRVGQLREHMKQVEHWRGKENKERERFFTEKAGKAQAEIGNLRVKLGIGLSQ